MRYIFIFFCLLPFSLISQDLDHVQGNVLFQLQADAELNELIQEFQYFKGEPTKFSYDRMISAPVNVHLGNFDFTVINEQEFIIALHNHPLVSVAQVDHILDYRAVPNDPSFNQQWFHLNAGGGGGTSDADIDTDLAWDITTGGMTSDGKEIVVCVVEGANRNHADLIDNMWTNPNEIPGNNIDDDNNGYVDDMDGWDFQGNDGNIPSQGHGTQVSGMIGAVGDNGIGIVGVNWDVKIMHVNFGNLTESNVIEAYTYPMVQRRIFNETNGEQGAFVVAMNSSWGIDGGDPAAAPLWCAMYDTMGVDGILNCGATANNNVNIDVVGDLPTACASDYMIAVTATNNDDVRTFSGYGATTIDFGAPGEDVYLTSGNGGYGNTSGTSFASPCTAGLIALLYSAPCNNLGANAIANPEGTAQAIRYALFEGVDVIPNLVGETVTGGRINCFNSVQILMASCADCPLPIAGEPNALDESIDVTWLGLGAVDSVVLEYRELGAPNWTVIPDATSPYSITGLTPCVDYEYRLLATCGDSLSSGYSTPDTVTTKGCGSCLDFQYCTSEGGSTVKEWINNVTLNTLFNTSGNDQGYGDFTGNGTTLAKGTTYNLFLSQGYVGPPFSEYFKVWIDYNQDGDFEDFFENVYDGNGTTTNFPNVGTFTVPTLAIAGGTRMRVSMQYIQEPDACDPDFNFGEVEEYCIEIVSSITEVCDAPMSPQTNQITDTTAVIGWQGTAAMYRLLYKKGDDDNWEITETSDLVFPLSGLEPCTRYDFQIQAVCDSSTSTWVIDTFRTAGCLVNVNDLQNAQEIAIFPNPFTESFSIDLTSMHDQQNLQLLLMDATGKVVKEEEIQNGLSTLEMDGSSLATGIYFVKILGGNGQYYFSKIVKE